mmetsp:Transcript_147206/g.472802  ORF Transcript_147206/g.472802 Transcript_147206/m.472802 type:complete len:1055 (-) Transcript_147206:119-3283(-)
MSGTGKNGYVQLSQLSQIAAGSAWGSPSGRARSRPLVMAAVGEGPWSKVDDGEPYVDNAFCVPAGKGTKTNWTWVGNGNGTYVQSEQYAYVGKGAGDYDPQLVAPTVNNPNCVCCRSSLYWCAAVLVVLGLAGYGAMAMSPERVWLRWERPRLSWMAPSTTVRAPSRYFCVLPSDVSGGLAAGDDPRLGVEDQGALAERWSEEKKAWCCEHAGVACLQQTTSSPFDCSAGYSNWVHGWSLFKQSWCCQHFGKGCAEASPALAALPYDCSAELTNWQESWSHEKQSWCCQHSGQGCVRAPAAAAAAVAQPFDCAAGFSNWEAGWSADKKHWCCQNAGRGCSPAAAPSAPFDCEAGYSNAALGWSDEKKRWCCQRAGRGCASQEVPLVCQDEPAALEPQSKRAEAQNWCCQKFGRLCEQAPAYDCRAAWQDQWSVGKRAWCCLHEQTGCPTTTAGRIYSCGAGEAEDAIQAWGAERRSWCCFHQGIACPDVGQEEFDCARRRGNEAELWDPQKQAWCCGHYGRACETTTAVPASTSMLYDCHLESSHWSLGQVMWCCVEKGLGCTTPMFDCSAGYSNWERGWSDAKKSWCCQEDHRGCPEAHDCAAGYSNWERGWSATTKSWCCLRHSRGCPEVAHTSTMALHTTEVTTTMVPYDCEAGFLKWEAGWSPQKKAWCCQRVGRACATTRPPYDCDDGYRTWESSWSIAKTIWCCQNGGFDCEGTRTTTTAGAPIMPVMACDLNCFGDGAEAVKLYGSLGEGDGAAVRGLSLEQCRESCHGTADCEGILYTNGTAAKPMRQSMCFGKKNFHISKCQPGDLGVVTEVLKTMPWGQCAIVGDPHVITWDRVFGQGLLQTDPGDHWLVKSTALMIMGRFGFTDRFTNASSATGVAVTGPMVHGHRLVVEYVGPAQGHEGFKATWDGQTILATFPSSITAPDGALRARFDYMNPSDFHREGRHTIGGTEGNLPSYLFEIEPDLSIYVLTGPDNCNIVITTRKIQGGQEGYCGNFNCNPDDDLLEQLQAKGLAGPVPLNESVFPEPPKAPRALGALLYGGPAED